MKVVNTIDNHSDDHFDDYSVDIESDVLSQDFDDYDLYGNRIIEGEDDSFGDEIEYE